MTAPIRKSMPGPISIPPKRGVSSDLSLMNIELDIMAAPALVPARKQAFLIASMKLCVNLRPAEQPCDAELVAAREEDASRLLNHLDGTARVGIAAPDLVMLLQTFRATD